MLYADFIKKMRGCPFCAPRQRVFARRGKAYLTYSIAPYARYHLLVIPFRHVESFTDLTPAEARDAQALVRAGVRVLAAKGIDDYTVLVRNGGRTGRSVRHLHYHLIPKHRIGDLDREQRFRRVLTPRATEALAREVAASLRRPKPKRSAK
jgi:diadenosine tetraphosphate (Ap4A) HIT family hydrolase